MYIQPTKVNGQSIVPEYGSNPFISGFELTISSATTLTINPGSARDYSSPNVIMFNPFATPDIGPVATVDINTNGLNGCWPIPIANVTLTDFTILGLYVLGDSSGINPTSFVIATGDNFVFPGYDSWRRIGSVYVNHLTREFIPFIQAGNGNDRDYVLQDNIPPANYGPTTFFPIPLSLGKGVCNPNFATHIFLQRGFTANALTDIAYISPTNLGTIGTLPLPIQSPATGGALVDEVISPVSKNDDGNNAVYVTVVGAGAVLGVGIYGWRESLGLQAI